MVKRLTMAALAAVLMLGVPMSAEASNTMKVNQGIAWRQMHLNGVGQLPWQFTCLNNIVMHESGWRTNAREPHTGAYGIGQALPASKMRPYGRDYLTSPDTQLRWMFAYIHGRYGMPCDAWRFWQRHNWY